MDLSQILRELNDLMIKRDNEKDHVRLRVINFNIDKLKDKLEETLRNMLTDARVDPDRLFSYVDMWLSVLVNYRL